MKKILFIVGPLLLLFMIGYVVAAMGFVNVPGISPTKFGKPVEASKNPSNGFLATLDNPLGDLATKQAAAQRAAADAAAKTTPQTDVSLPKPDPELGYAKLAELWNEMDVEKLKDLTVKWQPAALAKVLMKMDSDQVTKLLDSLDSKRADAISRAVQAAASMPPPDGASA